MSSSLSTHRFVIGASRKEIDEVKEAAKALGVILGDCQVTSIFYFPQFIKVGTKKTGADSPPIKQEAEEEISREGGLISDHIET